MDGWKGETRGAPEAKRVGSAERTTRLRCGLTVCGPTKAPPAMPERESIGRDRKAWNSQTCPGLFEERDENFMEFADQ